MIRQVIRLLNDRVFGRIGLILALVLLPGLGGKGMSEAAAEGCFEASFGEASAQVVEALLEDGVPKYWLTARSPDGAILQVVGGWARLEEGVLARPSDRFALESVLKVLVAGEIVQQIAEGRLSDGSLNAIDPEYEFPSEGLRVGHLLGHRGGVPNLLRMVEYRETLNGEPFRRWEADDILGRLAAVRDRWGELGKFGYSNENYLLLALFLEAVAGRDWEDVLRLGIHQQIGLSTTRYGRENPAVAEEFADGYRFGAEPYRIEYGTHWFNATGMNASWAHAGGDASTTLDDLQRIADWVLTTVNERAWNTREAELAGGWVEISAGVEYGAGRMRWDGRWIGHSGDVPGYSTVVLVDPETQWTVALACNLSNTPQKENPAEKAGLNLLRALAGEVKP